MLNQITTLLLLVASTIKYAKGSGDQTQNRPSLNWWSRLIESSSIQDGNPMPVNRRSHSATVYRFESENETADINKDAKEYMILSGGFTDQDWQTFPVWAYDMTRARSIGDVREELKSEPIEDQSEFEPFSERRSPWIDLTGLRIGSAAAPDELNEFETESSQNITSLGPQGRVGHLSSIYNDCLYIFGGLTYSLGSFHVENDNGEEDDSDEKNTVIVWKACGLRDIFADTGGKRSKLDGTNKKVGLLQWNRIVPKVDTSYPVQPSIDEKSKEVDNNHRRAAVVPTDDLTSLVQEIEPIMLSRGEAQGGHYSSSHGSSAKDCFIIYGGMHRHRTSVLENGNNAPSTNNEVPLGDVWKYDYETETLSLLAPYPPLEWQVSTLYTEICIMIGTYPCQRIYIYY